MRVSKRPYGVSGPLSTHTEVKPRSGTSLEAIKSHLFSDIIPTSTWHNIQAKKNVQTPPPHRSDPTRFTLRREAYRPSGWDHYLSVLERHRVPENQRRGCMQRAEAFIEAMKPTRMGKVSAAHSLPFQFAQIRVIRSLYLCDSNSPAPLKGADEIAKDRVA